MNNLALSWTNRLSRFFEIDVAHLIKGGSWMNANFIATSLLGLLSSVLLARFVSKDAYGTYQFILAAASAIAVFAPNTMSSAVIRSVAQGNEGDLVRATSFQLRWGLIASVIALAVSGWYLWQYNLGLSAAFLLVALLMPSTLALNTWGAYLQGKKEYRGYFFYNLLGTAIAYGGVIAAIFIKPEFFWLALGNILFAFLANLILYRLTIKKYRPNKQTAPDTLAYGTHLSVMGIPKGLVGPLDALLIFHFLGAAPLAIYSFATILPEKLIGGLKAIPTMALPKFSEKNEEDVKTFFKKKIWWLLLFLGIIAALYALVAPFLFDLLFPTYTESIPFTRVYALSFFAVAASVIHAALLSQKKTKELYYSTIASPLVKAGLLVGLMIPFGIWGIIWAKLITIAFQIILPTYLLYRR
ncbi:MAG: oligosaccharide flippase family protein [Patescibacteria group bacterium]|nr:oligosaccharide flippase family protein [Patescibacteria group bacterium]